MSLQLNQPWDLSIPSTSPFLLTLPVKWTTLVSVPTVSKKSTKKAKATPIKRAVAIKLKSK